MDTIQLSKTIKGTADGLSLMILFTLIWTIIAMVAVGDWSHRSFGLIFLVIITSFVIYYFKFNRIIKPFKDKLKDEETPENKKRDKIFLIIFIIEGFLILVLKNVLVNIKMDYLFISGFALIVGLHFFPLGKLFHRKIDYYIASWITIIAILGIFMSFYRQFDQNIITAFIGFGCAIGTSIMGIFMVLYCRLNIKLLMKLKK